MKPILRKFWAWQSEDGFPLSLPVCSLYVRQPGRVIARRWRVRLSSAWISYRLVPLMSDPDTRMKDALNTRAPQ